MINVHCNQNVQSSQVARIVTCMVMVADFVHFMDAGLGYPEGCNWICPAVLSSPFQNAMICMKRLERNK